MLSFTTFLFIFFFNLSIISPSSYSRPPPHFMMMIDFFFFVLNTTTYKQNRLLLFIFIRESINYKLSFSIDSLIFHLTCTCLYLPMLIWLYYSNGSFWLYLYVYIIFSLFISERMICCILLYYISYVMNVKYEIKPNWTELKKERVGITLPRKKISEKYFVQPVCWITALLNIHLVSVKANGISQLWLMVWGITQQLTMDA